MVGEMVLVEMRRMLSPDGLRLVVGWRGDVERESGPPKEVLDGSVLLSRTQDPTSGDDLQVKPKLYNTQH